MPLVIDINIDGITQTAERLGRIAEAIDPERILDESSAIILNRIRARFLRQESPDGATWPVSQAALKRQKSGRDGGTLFDSGGLFHSIDVATEGAGQREIGTNAPYARKHQEGDGVEKREFLGFSQEDADVIEALIKARFEKAR